MRIMLNAKTCFAWQISQTVWGSLNDADIVDVVHGGKENNGSVLVYWSFHNDEDWIYQ